MQENGYFRIQIRDGISVLRIIPPATSSGAAVTVDEIMKYLESHRYTGVDSSIILRALSDSSKETEVSLGIFDDIDMSADYKIRISLDKMSVTCRLYPPTTSGLALSANDIISDIQSKGIRFGIDEDMISQMVSSNVYCTDFVIANGIMPRHGIDAKIEYHFQVDRSSKPKVLEDGSVDFYNINTISSVKKDELLATLHPADAGKPGRDVYGNTIPQRQPKGLSLFASANTYLSDDKFSLYSSVNGHVFLINDTVIVSSEFEVEKDVDLSTGNIVYDGSVHVKGNVCDGFVVEADGDVVVDGVIEGAIIKCGGQVIIRKGIQGQGKVHIEAGSNVFCKYIENATIISGGYIEADSVINSDISADGDIIITGKKGVIMGGKVRSGGKIEVNTAGNDLGVTTVLEVGPRPEIKERFMAGQKRMAHIQGEIAKLDPVLNAYARALNMGKELNEKQTMYMNLVNDKIKTYQSELNSLKTETNALSHELCKANNARIVVNRNIYPGVKVLISGAILDILEQRSFCQLRSKQGSVEIVNM